MSKKDKDSECNTVVQILAIIIIIISIFIINIGITLIIEGMYVLGLIFLIAGAGLLIKNLTD